MSDAWTSAGSETALDVPLDGSSDDSSARLLGFYDHLRQRIVSYVARRGSRLGARTAEVLLLVPDVFILLVRLALDREVPESTRALIGGALLYFLLPLDFFPEGLLGPAAFVDDIMLALAVLTSALGGKIEPYAQRHWSGRQDLKQVLTDVAETAQTLVGTSAYGRLRRLLGRYGVRLG